MSKGDEILGLQPEVRRQIWAQTVEVIERYYQDVGKGPTGPATLDPGSLRGQLQEFTFAEPISPSRALQFAAEGLRKYQVHTPHPRYFGLFNPAPSAMGVVADALVAACNPQLAAWSHNPFANEVEQHLIRAFGQVFGYKKDEAEGTFASGGAEANLTAVLCALVHAFPQFAVDGLRAVEGQPVLYISQQAHHSFLKAARCCGLGSNAVREVPVGSTLTLDIEALRAIIRSDREQGRVPFLVVATAGTTSAGILDDLLAASRVCREEQLWCHVDAAWGGAVAILPELKHCLNGIEEADSITFDAHKFLSIPMGAGMLLTRRRTILQQTFGITTDYMPAAVNEFGAFDPYSSSIQWSRRFIGLKLFLSLATAGWDGYAQVIREQVALGQQLRQRLQETGWESVNQTPLPVVCFTDRQMQGDAALPRVAQKLVESGAVWISTVRIPHVALRACITSYRTRSEDVEALVSAVNSAREEMLR
jgi:glutamate/tyrosine decarboxylase-like PLP-dependent enzyme